MNTWFLLPSLFLYFSKVVGVSAYRVTKVIFTASDLLSQLIKYNPYLLIYRIEVHILFSFDQKRIGYSLARLEYYEYRLSIPQF